MRRSAIDLSSECTKAERNCISDAVKLLPSGGNFLEIGTAAGGTLKEIIQTTDDCNLKAKFYVLDPFTYFPDQLKKVHQNLINSDIDPSRVVFWEGTTDTQFSITKKDKINFNFIFIDGDHKAFPLMKDLQWMDLLSVGGIACFHDYNEKFPGVIWSLDHFLGRNDQFKVISKVDSLVIIQRLGKKIRPVKNLDLIQSKFMQVYLRLRRSIKKRFGKLNY